MSIILTDEPQLGKHRPANRAERRRGAEPIRWFQTGPNSHAASFGPWVVEIEATVAESVLDPVQYEFSITPVKEKLGSDIPTLEMAKTVAVRFLALALRKGLDSLVEHGVIGVRVKAK